MLLPSLPETLRGALWQADQLACAPRPGVPCGHARLDAELPGGGWPTGALTELLIDGPGHGELRLLAPVLARLTQAGQQVVCIDPPYHPHGPALAAWGIDLTRVLWVTPREAPDACWAADQALSARCGVVLCWTREAPHQRAGLEAALRRLHLKAQEGDSLLFLLRPMAAAQRASPAALRVRCQPWPEAPMHLAVQLIKRRGPAMHQPLRLDTRAWLAEPLQQRLDKATAMQPATAGFLFPRAPVALAPAPAPAHAERPVAVPASA